MIGIEIPIAIEREILTYFSKKFFITPPVIQYIAGTLTIKSKMLIVN
jgi:hypothetical protein